MAQPDIGIKINPGFSSIKTTLVENPLGVMEQKKFLQISGQLGVYFSIPYNSRSQISTELLLIPILAKERITIKSIDARGNTTGDYSEITFFQRILALGLPIYAGYTIKNFNLNFGFQINYHLGGEGYSEVFFTNNGQPLTSENSKVKLDIRSIDIGLRPGLSYQVTPKLSVNSNYYWGLTNLIKPINASDTKWNVRQFTLGIQYRLTRK
jgi:hypothetical protein